MPDTALSTTSLILGRSLITAETIYQDVRERLARSLAKLSKHASFQEALGVASKILSEAEPDFADHLSQSDLAAWLAGFHWTSQQFPFWLNREFALVNEGPPKPPAGKLLWPWEEDQPIVRFPLLERAAESLEQRGILSKQEFDQAAADIKQRSFTMAGDNTAAVLEEIRDAIAKDVQEGTSLRGFQERFGEIVNASSLGPWHVETVYRTNVQSSFRDGRETLINDPIVNRVFPYQEYFAIRDARAREDHLALEKLGLDGTGIYRRDDPFWDRFTPPWDFNCLLPGTIVSGRIEAAMRSTYSGEAIEIVTAAGKRLRVTINHPVLTTQGFIPAKFIRKGMDVVSYDGPNDIRAGTNYPVDRASISHATYDPRRFSPGVNEHYRPATAADVFAALALHRPFFRLPVCPDDFHGDAACGDRNVDVVWADWQLRGRIQFSNNQLGQQLSLSVPNDPPTTLEAASRNGFFCTERYNPFSGGIPSSATLTDHVSAITLYPSPLRQLCLGSAAYLNASRYELPLNDTAIASGLTGQLQQRNPGFISLDQVQNVRNFNFSGHVYDFRADGGFIVADGMIVSNCRCGVSPLTISDAAAKGVREAREWLESGSPPATPEWRYQFIPFKPKPGFGQRGRVVRVAA